MTNARECPKCFGDSSTHNSRDDSKGRFRLRECNVCGYKWKTYEIEETELNRFIDIEKEVEKLRAKNVKAVKIIRIAKQFNYL